jgi:hypothetical protein
MTRAAILAAVALCLWHPAQATQGDFSDQGPSFEQLAAGTTWGRYDASDAAFFEHFIGPGWRCDILGEGCRAAILPPLAPTSPVPEPAAWWLLAAGLTVLAAKARRELA